MDRFRAPLEDDDGLHPVMAREFRTFQVWGMRALIAVLLVSIGIGIGSAVGIWAVVKRGDARRADIQARLCETLQGVSELDALRVGQIALRDAVTAGVLENARGPNNRALNNLADDYRRTAAVNSAYASIQDSFARAPCENLPPLDRDQIISRVNRVLDREGRTAP